MVKMYCLGSSSKSNGTSCIMSPDVGLIEKVSLGCINSLLSSIMPAGGGGGDSLKEPSFFARRTMRSGYNWPKEPPLPLWKFWLWCTL